MAQKNKKELKKLKVQLLKEIEQLKLMVRAMEEQEVLDAQCRNTLLGKCSDAGGVHND